MKQYQNKVLVMSVERCVQKSNQVSSGFQETIAKFKETDLHKRVAVGAEISVASLKSLFQFTAGGVPAFRSSLNRGIAQDQLNPNFILYSKSLSGEGVKSKHTKEELANRLASLGKRWAFKLIPQVVPGMKVPFKIIKISKEIFSLGQSVYNKDLVGVGKKLIPIAFGIIGTVQGGPTFGAIFFAVKVYGWAILFFDTAKEAKNVYCYWTDSAGEPTKVEKVFDSTVLVTVS